jgi:hypothetical protein
MRSIAIAFFVFSKSSADKAPNKPVFMAIKATKALIASAPYINMRATLRQAIPAGPQSFLI